MSYTFQDRRTVANLVMSGELTRREAKEWLRPSSPIFLLTQAALRESGLLPVTVREFANHQIDYADRSGQEQSHVDIVGAWAVSGIVRESDGEVS